MAATPICVETDFQRLIVERALALAQELEKTSEQAPDGQVLHQVESLLLTHGREFLTKTLEQTLQLTADQSVKKKTSPDSVPAAKNSVTKVPHPGQS
jgi:hypothetical protein